jgi:hypothetical protein
MIHCHHAATNNTHPIKEIYSYFFLACIFSAIFTSEPKMFCSLPSFGIFLKGCLPHSALITSSIELLPNLIVKNREMQLLSWGNHQSAFKSSARHSQQFTSMKSAKKYKETFEINLHTNNSKIRVLHYFFSSKVQCGDI